MRTKKKDYHGNVSYSLQEKPKIVTIDSKGVDKERRSKDDQMPYSKGSQHRE